MNAGKDGDLVANPDVIVDDDWSLLHEALGHHGDYYGPDTRAAELLRVAWRRFGPAGAASTTGPFQS